MEKVKKLPQTPGVYIYKDKGGEVIYVGKAKNLKSRVSSYFRINLDRRSKTFALAQNIHSIDYIKVESELEALILEAELIKKYLPIYNVNLKDDKSFLYIGIRNSKESVGGKVISIPTVETFRKGNAERYKYRYGPFPDGKTVKQLVRMLRRMFPFKDCSTSKFCRYKKLNTPCLWGHLNLCPAPCVYEEAVIPVCKSNIRSIKNILSGGTSRIIEKYNRQMKRYAAARDYESAASLRDLLQRFEYVRQSFRLPRDYIENPYLIDDLAKEALENIISFLPFLKEIPTRIECYDISNISGKEAVGSMVTAINGRIDKSGYKRFRIRTKQTPDDFLMLYEVLYRRLSHETDEKKKSWGLPSLIVLDGGKGQLSSGLKVLEKLNLDVPIIGIAKHHETIVYNDNGFHETTPALDLPGMRLLLNLRDESHRFAQKYHHALRSKQVFGRIVQKKL